MSGAPRSTGEKRVAVVQPCYVPWRGYFDIIGSVDLFVVYDDVQYSRGTWQNRNRLKFSDGLRWLTVPVRSRLGMAIDEVPIAWDDRTDWARRHERLLEAALAPAPHGADAIRLWRDGVAGVEKYLSPLNVRLMRVVCEYLGIETPVIHSRGRATSGKSTERLVGLLEHVGATRYLSGPSARAYLDHDLFRSRGIALEYKSYTYAEYPQLWGAFTAKVSVLDLIANVGPDARDHLRSLTPDETVIECA